MNLALLALALAHVPAVDPPEAAPAPGAELRAPPVSFQDDDADDAGDGGFQALTLLVGLRQFDEDDWEPLDEQAAFGLEFVSQSPSAAFGFELGLSYSSEEDDLTIGGLGTVEAEVQVLELYAGLHRSFLDSERVRPYLGGGLTFLSGEIDASTGAGSASEEDETFGLYLRGGFGFEVSDSVELGLDLRAVLGAEFDIEDTELDADFVQASAFAAFRL